MHTVGRPRETQKSCSPRSRGGGGGGDGRGVIPDENYFYFESTLHIFFTFSWCAACRAFCPWHTAIEVGGLGVAKGPQIKLESSRCPEMHTQPYLSTLTFLYIKTCNMTSYDSLICMHVAVHVLPNIKVVGYCSHILPVAFSGYLRQLN